MPESVSNQSFMSRLSSGSSSKTYKCTIQLLDDSETISCDFKKNDLGQVLLDYVCEYLQIVEKDYFGLRFMDLNKHRYWLDTNKPILRQLHSLSPIVFCLRIKYYPSKPEQLKEEITRYQLFLQIRRDMLHGRLYCPAVDAAYLGACIVQSEVGDFDESELAANYVSEYKLFLKQTSKLEDRVAEVHKTLRGLNPADAELQFLKRASLLDTYGFDPYTVKDLKSGKSVYIGVTYQGVLVYHTNKKEHHIAWDQVQKVDYVGKEFRILPVADYYNDLPAGDQTLPKESTAVTHQHNNSSGNKSSSPTSSATWLKFQCPSATFAKHLWKYTLSQQAFFTLDKATQIKPISSKPRIPVFSRGSKFRYSGRVLQEIVEEGGPQRPAPSFVRHHIERQPGREERSYPWMTKYATLPKSTSAKLQGKDFMDGLTDPTRASEAPEARQLEQMEYPSEQEQRCSPVHEYDAKPRAYQRYTVTNLDHCSKPIPVLGRTNVSGEVKKSWEVVCWTSVDRPNISQPVFNESATADRLNRQPTDLLNDSQPINNIHSPLANSTPLKNPPSTSQSSTTTTSVPPSSNRQLPNDNHLPHDVSVDSTSSNAPTTCKGVFYSALVFLLLLLICASILVACLEVRQGSVRSTLDSVPGMAEFRHLYYEPMRRKALAAIQK